MEAIIHLYIILPYPLFLLPFLFSPFIHPLVILSLLLLCVVDVCSFLSTVLTLAHPHTGTQTDGGCACICESVHMFPCRECFHGFLWPVRFISVCHCVQTGTVCPLFGCLSLCLVNPGDITL